ncbi:MAG: hypothetical protein ACTS6G_05905 [Candidatus Hodgkinia cicadicola]
MSTGASDEGDRIGRQRCWQLRSWESQHLKRRRPMERMLTSRR